MAMKVKSRDSGKLRIGDDWNAIRIIALSQSNPLKAIAEFVENSIDAHAKTITITRGKEHGAHYLAIKDDGDGVPRGPDGLPDFKYVATHICDSIKRQLKANGSGTGLQGEFGIGLLSFWTVGNSLTMISTGTDQKAYQMTMSKGDSRYEVSPRRVLFAEKGTELKISPLLEGIRTLSGEKIQWYLASELRDRIRVARYLQGLIDVPFLNLTPGTRSGIIHDERYAALMAALEPLETHVKGLIEEQQRAEEEQASQQSLKAIQRAFHEALLALPREEYDWFDIQGRARREGGAAKPNVGGTTEAAELDAAVPGVAEPGSHDAPQRQFFEYAGPLYSVVVSPAASTTPLNEVRTFRALPRDRSRRRVQDELTFNWEILEGEGSLQGVADQELAYRAPAVPGLTRLRVTVTQRETTCCAEALVTITDSLEAAISPAVVTTRGLPGYTFERAAGELWRCRFDAERNIIVVNSGHRDFVFATRNRALQLRYLVRLYVKELVLKNFAGLPPDQLLERMIELSLYAEEKLKSG